ncbi:Fe-S cluster assembly protein SufD [Bacteroidales bacterium]|nr:Fe-S cluster assembly protein SufD [Bacteroidales bacterium]
MAFEVFKEIGFPKFNSEEYQHTDISSLLESDLGLNINNLKIPINPYEVFKCDVPNLSTNLYFMVNERFYAQEEVKLSLPQGVFSGSLNTFAEQYPSIFSKYYGQLAKSDKDGLVAFNTLFAQDGYVLYVPKNVVVEQAIQLVNVLRGDTDTLANRRLLIIIEEGAQAKLLACDHTFDEKPKFVASQVCEIFVAKNALFDYYELEESSENTVRLSSTFVKQEASSNVVCNTITLLNGVTRNNYHISLDGEHAETHLYGMAIADKKQKVDNHTNIAHNVPNCLSNELFKYVLDDQAVGAFSGRILVAIDAQKTLAYQNNRNLCASRECRMFAKPQLEIYADDVKCSHGLTTGQLDETALFYMRSRGISEEEARMLLKFAFTHDVIEGIRLEALRDRLKLLVEKRFRGELMKCAGCCSNDK